MVGSALWRALQKKGYSTLLGKSSTELDLRNQVEVNLFFEKEQPEYVILAAAKVGGIVANNTYRADILFDNLTIQTNVIHAAWKYGVRKLLFLGSSCIYPKFAEQPIKEESLMTGPLEQTNEPYAIAKIAGIKLCESYRRQYGCNFISALPTSLYGPNDNYDLTNSHVLPALIRKIHTAKKSGAKSVEIWGSGSPLREFLHVDDLANGLIFLMNTYDEEPILNIGSGEEISILNLAKLIQEIVGYEGALVFDASKPDGTPRKLLDNGKIESLGWKPSIQLREGIKATYLSIDHDWFE
jgi:GDP-L-fucose synthase